MTAETPATELTDAELETMAALRREIGPPTDRDKNWQPMVAAAEVRTLLIALDRLAARAKPAPSGDGREARATEAKLRDLRAAFDRGLHTHLLQTRLPLDDDGRILADRRTVSPAPSGDGDHEPVIGHTSFGSNIVGCSCMTTREWNGYVQSQGGPGWKAWAAHVRDQSPAPSGAEAALVEVRETFLNYVLDHPCEDDDCAGLPDRLRAALSPSAGPDEAHLPETGAEQ